MRKDGRNHEDQPGKMAIPLFVIGMSALVVWNLFTPSRAYSESENRYLQSFPSLSVDRLVSGEFAKSFDLYSSDQFPLRENGSP